MNSRIINGSDVVDNNQNMLGNISVKVTKEKFNETKAHYNKKEKIKSDCGSTKKFDFTLLNGIKVIGYLNKENEYKIVFQGKNSLILEEFEIWKKSIGDNPEKIEGELLTEIKRIFWS